MALIDDFHLSLVTEFQYRVQAALVSTAIAVQSESSGTANHIARSQFAYDILHNPQGYAERMSIGFTVDLATSGQSSDTQLKDRASAIFNAYALDGV